MVAGPQPELELAEVELLVELADVELLVELVVAAPPVSPVLLLPQPAIIAATRRAPPSAAARGNEDKGTGCVQVDLMNGGSFDVLSGLATRSPELSVTSTNHPSRGLTAGSPMDVSGKNVRRACTTSGGCRRTVKGR
jgi:hypothetical protein